MNSKVKIWFIGKQSCEHSKVIIVITAVIGFPAVPLHPKYRLLSRVLVFCHLYDTCTHTHTHTHNSFFCIYSLWKKINSPLPPPTPPPPPPPQTFTDIKNVRMWRDTHAQTHVCTSMCTHVHAQTQACEYVRTHTHTHTHTRTCMHAHAHTHTDKHAQTHTHPHTHTPTPMINIQYLT